MQQHDADRAEIHALNESLFKKNDASIGNMRVSFDDFRGRVAELHQIAIELCQGAGLAAALCVITWNIQRHFTHVKMHTKAHTHLFFMPTCPQELLSRVPQSGADGNDNSQQLTHLNNALARTNEDLGFLRNQLEQKDAAMEQMRRSYEREVRVCSCDL